MSDSEGEIADIIDRFALAGFINREQNNNHNQNMDNPAVNAAGNVAGNAAGVNYQLLRLYIDTIPHYHGDPHTLTVFINNCASLINNFYRANDNAHNDFIVRAIIGKLSGRALSLIGSRINELNTWNDVKTALELSFGDQRNLDCLIQDLIVLTPAKGETPYNFGMRCQDARSLIFSKLNSLNLVPADHVIRVKNYEELALKTFIRGLVGQLQNNIRLRDPRNLEAAMSLVIEEENFLYSQNRSNTINTQKFQPNQRMIPANSNGTIQKPINYQNNYSSNFAHFNSPRPMFNNNSPKPVPNNNFARPPFPNFQPRPFMPPFRPNNNFPTQKHPYFLQRNQPINNQNRFNPNPFNNSQNRFINNNLPNQQRRQEEPMDTSTGLTKFQRPNPKYTVTELHQQNVDTHENAIFQNQCFDSNFYYTEDPNHFDYAQPNPDLGNYEQYYPSINYDVTPYDQSYEFNSYENPTMKPYTGNDNAVLDNSPSYETNHTNENFTLSTLQKETT